MRELELLERQLEADLGWREAELAVFREMLILAQPKSTRARALYRAGWALLYAHYEGYCKFCLDLYLDALSKLLPDCRLLPDPLLVFLLDNEFRRLRELPATHIHNFITNDYGNICRSRPATRQVDTKSNLWPDTLRLLLTETDVGSTNVDMDDRKFSTLVARRNDIAHGKKVFIDEMPYYAEYEYAVIETMYSLTIATANKYADFVRRLQEQQR